MCDDCGDEYTDPCGRHRSFGHVPYGGAYSDGTECSTCCTACWGDPVPPQADGQPQGQVLAPDDLLAAVKLLPVNTLVKIGWVPKPGRVQGSLYLRTRDGLRYVGPERDNWESTTLHQECQAKDSGYEIVTPDVAAAGSPVPDGRGVEVGELIREAERQAQWFANTDVENDAAPMAVLLRSLADALAAASAAPVEQPGVVVPLAEWGALVDAVQHPEADTLVDFMTGRFGHKAMRDLQVAARRIVRATLAAAPGAGEQG